MAPEAVDAMDPRCDGHFTSL